MIDLLPVLASDPLRGQGLADAPSVIGQGIQISEFEIAGLVVGQEEPRGSFTIAERKQSWPERKRSRR
jgi:hypothetical protein